MDGWSQTGAYAVTDGTDSGDTLSGEHNNVLKIYTSIGTTLGGNSEPTVSNQIQNYYFRIDTNRADGSQFGKWNIQLNLGSTSQGQADYLLQFEVPSGTLSGVTFGTEGNIRLEQYTTSGGSGASEPVSLAVTTGALTNRVTSSVANGGSGRWSLAADNSNKQSIELAIPSSWFLSTNAPGSTVKSDGTGNLTLSGAVFSSTGSLGAVGTVRDQLRDASGNAVITTTNLRTGTTTFQNNQASQTNFGQQPTNVDVNTAISPAVTVRIEDSLGNVVTGATHEVTMAIGTNAGGGTLSGTLTAAAVSGVATFSDLAINAAGTGYTLVATVIGVGSATSGTFNVVVPSQTVTVSASDASASEAGPDTATFTVTRSGSTAGALTVLFGVSGTASSGSDFTALSGSVTIDSGSSTGTIALTPIDDTIDELDETVIITISTDAAYSVGSPSSATVTIADNDAPPTVSLSLNGSPMDEAAAVATVTGTLSAASSRDVRVNLTFSGNATLTSDYTRSAASFVIGAGATTGSVALTAVPDTTDEWNESIVVDVDSVWNATESGTQQVTAVIADDDPEPSVTLSHTGSPVAEAGGVATVTATISAASDKPVTVGLAFGGNATLTSDYARSATSITIAAGQTTGSITITGVQDAVDEWDQSVIVDVSSVANATESGTQQVTVVITDDDAAPTVTISQAGGPLAEAAGAVTVTATLSGESEKTVTVNLAFGGTATLSDDYTRSGASMTIDAGSVTGTITLTGVSDAIDENNEAIVVDIASVNHATESGTQQTTVDLVDDDAPPTVNLSQSGSPIAENGGTASVTATLSGASGKTVTVNLSFNGLATVTSDYTRSATSITIGPGATTGSITLTAVPDGVAEGDETIVVDVSTVANATESGTQQVTVSIADDEVVPSVTLGVSGSPVVEAGGVATITATLSGTTSADVTVNLGFSGNATLASDYTRSGTSIVIPAGSLTGSITLTAVQDALDEENQSVDVSITTVLSANEQGNQQVTATITDDDAPPTVTLSASGSPIAETGGTATVTSMLSGASEKTISISLVFGGNATLTSDYTRSSTSITIAAGQTTGTITLTAVQDALDEPSESIVIDVSSVTNGTESGSQQVIASITDDDAAPTVTIAASATLVAESSGAVTVWANLSAASGLAVTVTFGFGGSANGTTDYAKSGSSLVIAAGSTSGSITLTPTDDSTDEPTETVIIDVTSVANGNEDGSQQVTLSIADDDPPSLTVTASDASASEQGAATGTFTVARTAGDITGSLVVRYTLSGTAANGTDFAGLGGSLTIAAGQTSANVTVAPVDDLLIEGAETVVLTISTDAAYAVGSPSSATVSIADNDSPGITVTPTSGLSVGEAGTTTTFTVVLDTVPLANVYVPVSSSDATEGSVSATNLTFTPANALTPQTVTMTGVNDFLIDGTVNWTVITAAAISSDTNYAGLDANDVSAATTDDDAAGFTLAPSNGTTQVAESGSSDTFTVVLNAVPTGNVVLTVSSARPGEATVSPETLTFTPANWNVAQTVTITGVDDQVDDGTQTANVTVAVDPGLTADAYDGVASQVVAASVADDDIAAFTLVQSGGSTVVAEPSGADSFTLVLGSKPVSDVIFSISSGDLTEATVSSSTVTFTPSNWNVAQTVTINAADDSLVDGNQSSTITISIIDATSSDEYDALADQTLTATTTDNDSVGITLAATGGSTSVGESGSNDTFTLVLTAQPGSNVVLRVASADAGEVTAAPGWITFTPTNWNVAQTITLAGVDDSIIDGSQITNVTVSVNDANSSNEFDPVADQVVAATTTDDDTPGVIVVESGDSTSVNENGTTDSVTVRLTRQPAGNVVITVTSNASGEATVDKTRLYFGPGNYSVAQTVTVRGVDELTLDGTKDFTLTIAVDAALSSNEYDGMTASTLVGTNVDNDVEDVFQYQSHATNWDQADTMEVPLPPAVGSALFDAVMEIIRVNVTNNMSGAVILLTEVLASLPTNVPNPPTVAAVSTMWNITLFENATEEPIANASLRIWVPNSWISANCPPATCSVRVFHYTNGSWETLVPTIASTNATGITYQVVTTSFSPFVVGGVTVAAAASGGGGGGGYIVPSPPAPPPQVAPPAVEEPDEPEPAVPPELLPVTRALIPQVQDWSYLFFVVFGATLLAGGASLAADQQWPRRGPNAIRARAISASQDIRLAIRQVVRSGAGLYASMVDRTRDLWLRTPLPGLAYGRNRTRDDPVMAKAGRLGRTVKELRRDRPEGRGAGRWSSHARDEDRRLSSLLGALRTAPARPEISLVPSEPRPGAAGGPRPLIRARLKRAPQVDRPIQKIRQSRPGPGARPGKVREGSLVETHKRKDLPPARRVPGMDQGRKIEVIQPRGRLNRPAKPLEKRDKRPPIRKLPAPSATAPVKRAPGRAKRHPPTIPAPSDHADEGRVEIFRLGGHGLLPVRPRKSRKSG